MFWSINLAADVVEGIKLTSVEPTNKLIAEPKLTPQNAAIIPANGFRLFALNIIAANGINKT